MNYIKFKSYFVVLIMLLSIYLSVPTFISNPSITRFFPDIKIHQGLDLNGGISLTLELDLDGYINEQINLVYNDIKTITNNSYIENNSIIVHTNDQNYNIITVKLEEYSDNYNIMLYEDNHFKITMKQDYLDKTIDTIVDKTINIIQYRIDADGINEITIQRKGDSQILVEIPSSQNINQIKNIIGQSGNLYFYLVSDNQNPAQIGVKQFMVKNSDNLLTVDMMPIINGDMIADAQAGLNIGNNVVYFKLNSVGSKKFANFTQNNIGKAIAIVLDGVVIQSAMIKEPILNGSSVISGNFDTKSANELSIILRSGSLPTALNIFDEKMIGASLGKSSIYEGTKAIILGCFMVISIIILYYKILGVFASIALFFNLLMIISCLALFNATLTLTGLAGIALTLGMAVDANVLINERMKEELKKKILLKQVFKNSYNTALRTILDSNITTIIAAIILYLFGSTNVKSFALSLIIGILCSLCTSVIFTQVFIHWGFLIKRNYNYIIK